MKRSKFLLLSLLIASIGLVSCNSNNNGSIETEVYFYLNGGQCNEKDTEYIKYKYELESKEDRTYLFDPYQAGTVGKLEYVLTGWYKTRTLDSTSTEDNPSYTYSDPFDFETEKVGIEGLTLYACWTEDVKFQYNVCYTDPVSGEVKSLGVYDTEKGAEFEDYRNYTKSLEGYTFLDFYSNEELTTLWDSKFKHPGDKESPVVNVYAKFYEGDYTVVRTISDLRKVSGSANVLLYNDIDFNGENFPLFNNYRGEFNGNGHTIRNFKLQYNKQTQGDLYIAIFPYLNEATVKDVTFDNFSVDVETQNTRTQNVYISSLAGRAKGAIINNVVVSNYTVNISSRTNRPLEYDLSKAIFEDEDGNSTVTNFSITQTTMNDLRVTTEAVSLYQITLEKTLY